MYSRRVKQCDPQDFGIPRGQAEARPKDSRFVPATRMFDRQAVVAELDRIHRDCRE
jgi:hypothetical protein